MNPSTISSSPLQSQAAITAIGSSVPERRLTNEDLSRMVETDNEWIIRRTGIQERRIASPDEFTSDLAIAAVRDLLKRYPRDTDTIDGIIVATTTPDTPCPSVASHVQQAFNIPGCLTFDLSAACAGFVYALQVANGLILSGTCRSILVIGAETLSKITDYTDRSTCILFGDGAGAVLVEKSDSGAFLASHSDTEGAGGAHVYASGLAKVWNGQPLTGDGRLVQNGREVYKWALGTVTEGVQKMLTQSGLTPAELDWFVPHSANLRMIEAMCERLNMPYERALVSADQYGNTSAASIPLALDLAVRDGRLRPGQLIALYGFGSGLTQAGLLLQWRI